MATRLPRSSAGPARRAARLRPRRSDDLGLRRAMSDRLLPLLVGAMAFLAALALAGLAAASSLGARWQHGAAAALTVQVPDPGRDRLEAVLGALRADPAVAEFHALDQAEMRDLLRPWLGSAGASSGVAAGGDPAAGGETAFGLNLPAVVAVRLRSAADPGFAERLDRAAPGTLTEDHGRWIRRLLVLARSLEACAGLAVALVGAIAVAVVAVATRAGLAARRDAIETVHGLGATDGFIAGEFAKRATRLAAVGAACGTLLVLPVLVGLAALAAPFATGEAPEGLAGLLGAVPLAAWLALPVLPFAASLIGWLSAQFTVRRWLRRLP